jgi:subtilisin family serine protease
MRHDLALFIGLIVAPCAVGQTPRQVPSYAAPSTGRHWVYFADKGVAPEVQASIRALHESYPARALWRRQVRRTEPGLFDERDVAVRSQYIDRVTQAGARVHVVSRWLNAISVEADEAQIRAIRLLPMVTRIEPVRAGRRIGASTSEDIAPYHQISPYGARDFYGVASVQNAQIGLPALHAAGFTGQGVIVGVLDTGFRRDHSAFHTPGHELSVIAEYDFVSGDSDAGFNPADDSEQHRHGTWILSTLAAYAPEAMVGGAYDASFVLCKTEDVVTETPVEEDNYVAGIEFCELHGADLTTSSLGYIDWYTQADLDGRTAVTTIAVNIAAGNGVHCITAAGNSGHDANPATSTLGAPADGLYVISCGAVDDSGQIAGFSSSGPTADGRLKPELLAHGVNTAVTSSRNTTGYGTVSGTSLSTPIVASAVACLTQAHPGWTVAQMRAALMNTASDYAATGLTDPLFIRGYGIVNAFAALTALCDADITGDGGVDGDDVIAFFESWDAGHADFDASGGTDGDDVIAFFARWDAGC